MTGAVTAAPASVAPLDVVPLWAFLAATLLGILLAVETGYRLGISRRARADHEKETPVAGMVAAELGLFAFLLAFTFGLAATRFEARRQILLDETNAVGTAYLRAALLPEPHRTEVRRLLREYVDVRLAAVVQGTLQVGLRRSTELHDRLWAEVVAAAAQDPHSIPTGLFIQAVNDVIDIHAKRVMLGVRNRIPVSVWLVLFSVAALSFGAMGYHGGLTGTRRSPAAVAVAVTFAVVIGLIADLDRSQQGMLRVSQLPMTELRRSMTAPNP
jgi:hypothetical protein